VNDRGKLIAYRIFDPTKANEASARAHPDRRATTVSSWKECGAHQKGCANLLDMFRVMRDDTPHLDKQVFDTSW
jgi:hypothetical protein